MTSLRALRRRDLRLVPVGVAAWAAASFAVNVPGMAFAFAGCLWVAALVVLGVAGAPGWRRAGSGTRDRLRPMLALAAVALATGAAAASHVAFAQPTRTQAAQLAVDGGRALAIDAVVVGKVEPSATGWRFDATAERVRYGTTDLAVSFPIVVRTTETAAGLDTGAAVTIEGTARRADPGKREVLVVQAARGVRVRAPPAGVLAAASDLRRGLIGATDGLPQPAAGLIAGLAVGDTSAVSPELDEAMKASSLAHLTAVSGANCALVVGIAFGLAALCGARRGVRVAAGLVCLAGFVVLVSPEPSVVRAAAMATIALLGLLLGRLGAGVSLLSLAVCLLLVLDPWLSGSLGFALSVAATGSLLLAAGPLADGMSRWMPHPIALALSVPLAAQLACGPLLVLVNPTVPVYGVLANLLAAPAAPVGTVLGLLACLATPVPLIADGLAVLAWVPAAWIATTATTLTSLPGSTLPWLEGWIGAAALTVVGTAITILILVRRGGPRSRTRSVAVAVLGAATAIALALGPGTAVSDRLQTPTDWDVVACDVGQGDAILLRSEGRIALIDTGPDPAPLTACLDRFGVTELDLLVLTHFDLDHRGGVDAVVGRVGLVVHGPPGGPDDERLLRRLAGEGAEVAQAHAGMTGSLGATRWRVLWPRASGAGYPPGNDSGVVIDVTGGGLPTSLFLADLSAGPQRAVVASGLLAPGYALVKVAHHGSADQAAELYRAASPALALVTVGENTYGHPRDEILSLLTGLGTTIARTDTDGSISVTLAADGLYVWRERAPVSSR